MAAESTYPANSTAPYSSLTEEEAIALFIFFGTTIIVSLLAWKLILMVSPKPPTPDVAGAATAATSSNPSATLVPTTAVLVPSKLRTKFPTPPASGIVKENNSRSLISFSPGIFVNPNPRAPALAYSSSKLALESSLKTFDNVFAYLGLDTPLGTAVYSRTRAALSTAVTAASTATELSMQTLHKHLVEPGYVPATAFPPSIVTSAFRPAIAAIQPFTWSVAIPYPWLLTPREVMIMCSLNYASGGNGVFVLSATEEQVKGEERGRAREAFLKEHVREEGPGMIQPSVQVNKRGVRSARDVSNRAGRFVCTLHPIRYLLPPIRCPPCSLIACGSHVHMLSLTACFPRQLAPARSLSCVR